MTTHGGSHACGIGHALVFGCRLSALRNDADADADEDEDEDEDEEKIYAPSHGST